MDCSPPGSSVCGILQAKLLERVALDVNTPHFPLQSIFLTQESNPCFLHLLHCQVDSFPLPHLTWSLPIFWLCYIAKLPGASMRNSAHGKGHEEGGLAYAKAWSSLRKPPGPEHLTPKPESVLCSHLHFWLYGGLSPITVSLGEGVNVQLQDNKDSWAWQECFSLRTPLKVI